MILGKNLDRTLAVFGFVISLTVSAGAQSVTSPDAGDIKQQLTVPDGAPLRIILTKKVRFKSNQPVQGKLVEPVAFDREVLPAGTEVTGHISGFKSAPRWVRITSMAGGNFTPLREPQLTFDSLTMKDGKSIPIRTFVTPGADRVVRFNAGAAEQKKGRVATATEAARQQIEAKRRAVIDAIKGPGKWIA